MRDYVTNGAENAKYIGDPFGMFRFQLRDFAFQTPPRSKGQIDG